MNTFPVLFKSYLIAVFVGILLVGGGLYFTNFVEADTASTTVDVGNATPSVSDVEIDNGASSITLIPNTITTVDISATISDNNGCNDVFTGGSITAVFYRSDVSGGSGCTSEASQCYRNLTLTEINDSCATEGDTSGNASTTVEVWFFADATDASSTLYSAATWQVAVTATDGDGASASSTDLVSPPNVDTLSAINVENSTINFALDSGTLIPGTTSTVADINRSTTTVVNTGNSTIDLSIEMDPMISGGNSIGAENQKFDTSAVGYESLSYTGTTTVSNFNLAKATTSTAPSSIATFWGISIPAGQSTGTYSGTDTFTVIWDSTE